MYQAGILRLRSLQFIFIFIVLVLLSVLVCKITRFGKKAKAALKNAE